MISPDFDVLVVGGGCAGLSASISAVECGASVLLAERESEIGKRIICAEGVSAEALRSRFPVDGKWISAIIDEACFYASDGTVASLTKPGSGLILDKAWFLRSLGRMAESKGVTVKTSCKVVLCGLKKGSIEVYLAGSSYRVRSIVAADGIDSMIARSAGVLKGLKPDDVFVCAQALVDGIDLEPSRVEFHLSNSLAPGGYAWVFPKGEDRANVGVGMIGSNSLSSTAHQLLKRFIEKRCPRGKVLKLVFGGVPSVKRFWNGIGSGIFTAGDAARVADPVSGAGIISAIDSGRIAGRLAARYALGEISLTEAEKQYRNEIKRIDRFRYIRFALRKAMKSMGEKEICKFVSTLDQFLRSGKSLDEPIGVLKYFVLRMPDVFGKLAAHIRV